MGGRLRSSALAAAALLLAAAVPAVAQTTYSGTGVGGSAAAASFTAAIGASTLETFDARPDGELISNWGMSAAGPPASRTASVSLPAIPMAAAPCRRRAGTAPTPRA